MPISSREKIPMTEKVNRRDAAISAYVQREADAARAASDRARAEQEQAHQQQTNLSTWQNRALVAIATGVIQTSDDFARRGSPFIIRRRPDCPLGTAAFEVHRSGSLHQEAELLFALQPGGSVRAETNATGADLPVGIAVDAVTPEWAEQAAEQVLFAVLGGQRIPIPEDDFIKGGFQTSVPVQPRRPRRR
jgi:hypothetical protein